MLSENCNAATLQQRVVFSTFQGSTHKKLVKVVMVKMVIFVSETRSFAHYNK